MHTLTHIRSARNDMYEYTIKHWLRTHNNTNTKITPKLFKLWQTTNYNQIAAAAEYAHKPTQASPNIEHSDDTQAPDADADAAGGLTNVMHATSERNEHTLIGCVGCALTTACAALLCPPSQMCENYPRRVRQVCWWVRKAMMVMMAMMMMFTMISTQQRLSADCGNNNNFITMPVVLRCRFTLR